MTKTEFTGVSLPAKPDICNDPIIFDGFGSEIAPVNDKLVGEDMMSLPFGRAYKNSEPERFTGALPYYASKIHVAPVGEFDHVPSLGRISHLAKSERPGIYMGAAGMINFSYIAAIKPAAAILFDVNPLQKLFWDYALKAARENEQLDGFLSEMSVSEQEIAREINDTLGQLFYRGRGVYSEKTPMSNTDLFRDTEDWVYFHHSSQPALETKWWRREDGYAHLHAMAKQDAIAVITLDMFHEPSWRQLERALAGNKVSTMYTSNILAHPDWTGRDHYSCDALVARAWENIGLISDLRTTRFINEDGIVRLPVQNLLGHLPNPIFKPIVG